MHTTSVEMLVCSVIGISALYDIGAPPPSIDSDDDADDDDGDNLHQIMMMMEIMIMIMKMTCFVEITKS